MPSLSSPHKKQSTSTSPLRGRYSTYPCLVHRLLHSMPICVLRPDCHHPKPPSFPHRRPCLDTTFLLPLFIPYLSLLSVLTVLLHLCRHALQVVDSGPPGLSGLWCFCPGMFLLSPCLSSATPSFILPLSRMINCL